MRLARASFALLPLVLSLAACGDDEAPIDTPDGGEPVTTYSPDCENLNPQDCLLPWPSSRFLVDDATTATGRRISVPAGAMPRAARGPTDPSIFSRFDGFSPATSIVTSYAGDVDPSNLADEHHIDDSLAASSTTIILDAETGERVAHFAELDTWPTTEAERRPLYLRPATRLAERRRYLVAIRNLRHPDGTAIEPSEYFRALRDGTPLPEAADLEARRAHFEDVFTRLAAAGVERSSLLEAWDFETGSDASLWGETIAIRDEGLRRMARDTDTNACTVTMVEDEPAADVFRRVHGTVRVPLFLVGEDPNSTAESELNRNAAGEPAFNRFMELPFTLTIPMSVKERVEAGGDPARLLDYGHGLFGSRRESHSGWFRDTVQRTEMVSVSIDWWGWSESDIGRVAQTLQNFSHFTSFAERAVQGVVNHVFLHRAFREGGCAQLPEFQIARAGDDEGATAPAFDPQDLYYYGNSQGGIFGLSLAGVAVDVERFVLGVGGSTYSIMIPRSSNWTTYGSLMAVGYPDPLHRSTLMVMAQSLFDLAEPATYARHVVRDPLPCATDVCSSGSTPAKFVLSQVGRDDAQVAPLTAEIAARTMGIPYVAPAPYEPWGLDAVSGERGAELGDHALVIFDIAGTPVLPLGTRDPMGDNPAHEGVRRSAAAIEQLDRFLRPDGVVVQTCDGVCS